MSFMKNLCTNSNVCFISLSWWTTYLWCKARLAVRQNNHIIICLHGQLHPSKVPSTWGNTAATQHCALSSIFNCGNMPLGLRGSLFLHQTKGTYMYTNSAQRKDFQNTSQCIKWQILVYLWFLISCPQSQLQWRALITVFLEISSTDESSSTWNSCIDPAVYTWSFYSVRFFFFYI